MPGKVRHEHYKESRDRPNSRLNSSLELPTTGIERYTWTPPAGPKPKPVPKMVRHQLNKVGAGTAAIIILASPQLAATQEGITNSIDDANTNDSAQLVQAMGVLEVEAGTGIGNLVPSKLPAGKCQLDKVVAGTAALIGLADLDLVAYQEGFINNIDGDETSDTAVGQQLGALEDEMGSGAGNLVPSKMPAAKVPAGR